MPNLAAPLTAYDLGAMVFVLGRYGVLPFAATNSVAGVSAFAGRFGAFEVNTADAYREPGHALQGAA